MYVCMYKYICWDHVTYNSTYVAFIVILLCIHACSY